MKDIRALRPGESGELMIPQYNLGGVVSAELLVARTQDTACVVRRIAADPDGFAFELMVRLRDPVENLVEQMDQFFFVHGRRRPDRLYLEVRFSDGRTFVPPQIGKPEPEFELESIGGG